MTSRIHEELTFFRVPTAFEEVEKHMFGSRIDIKVSCVHTNLARNREVYTDIQYVTTAT